MLMQIYEGESTENLKSSIKIRTTILVSFNNDTRVLKSCRQMTVRYYKSLSHTTANKPQPLSLIPP